MFLCVCLGFFFTSIEDTLLFSSLFLSLYLRVSKHFIIYSGELRLLALLLLLISVSLFGVRSFCLTLSSTFLSQLYWSFKYCLHQISSGTFKKWECRWLKERDGGPVIRANRLPDFHCLCDGMTRRLEELCQSLEACLWPCERVTVAAPPLELSEWLFRERETLQSVLVRISCSVTLTVSWSFYKHLQFYLTNFSHLIFFL